MEPLKGRSLEESGTSLAQLSKLTLKMKNRQATRNDNSFFDCCKGGITAIENSISEERDETEQRLKREVFINVRDDDEDCASQNS